MIDRLRAESLASSVRYQRDRAWALRGEVQELEAKLRDAQKKASDVEHTSKLSHAAFSELFAPILVPDERPEYCGPHCDQYVLHAPGQCRHCDGFPRRQAARVEHAVNFTGERDPAKCPCPSELLRGLETVEAWPGNRPRPEGD